MFNPVVLSEKVSHQRDKIQYQCVRKRTRSFLDKKELMSKSECIWLSAAGWMRKKFQREVRAGAKPRG